MKVRVGFQCGTHAARQRAHLIRTAAAFYLTSIALHTHFLARKIQRKKIKELEKEKKDGEEKRSSTRSRLVNGFEISIEMSRGEIVVLSIETQEPLFSGSYFSTSVCSDGRVVRSLVFFSFFFLLRTKYCRGRVTCVAVTPPLKTLQRMMEPHLILLQMPVKCNRSVVWLEKISSVISKGGWRRWETCGWV